MIHLTSQTRILLAVEPADFRGGIDKFVGRCQQQLQGDPRDGTLFVFSNRSRTMVRILAYEGNGYWLITKRLSRNKFAKWPNNHHNQPVCQLIAKQLITFLRGQPCTRISNQ